MQASQEEYTDYVFFSFLSPIKYIFYNFFIHLDVKNGAYSHLIKRKEMEWAYVFDSYQLMSSVVPVFLIEIKT